MGGGRDFFVPLECLLIWHQYWSVQVCLLSSTVCIILNDQHVCSTQFHWSILLVCVGLQVPHRPVDVSSLVQALYELCWPTVVCTGLT